MFHPWLPYPRLPAEAPAGGCRSTGWGAGVTRVGGLSALTSRRYATAPVTPSQACRFHTALNTDRIVAWRSRFR